MEQKAPTANIALHRQPEICLDRLKRDLQELSRIGRRKEDRGIYRMAFTRADMEAKQWLMDRLKDANLPAIMDGAANVWSRLEGVMDGPSVIIGSHLDTVPCAGSLDGSVGVLIGLECFRALQDAGFKPQRPLELVSFSDEEGRFGGMLGSQAVAGLINPEVLYAQDLNGISLGSAMEEQGLNPQAILDAVRPAGSIHRYLEVHIEQGPILDRSGQSVGIVDEITGLFKWSIQLRGEANHAGTTPMSMRRDAFMGLADFAHEIPRILDENGTERSRATIGKAEILPGAANTVAGRVEFTLDVRDTDNVILGELASSFRKALSSIARRRQLMFDFEVLSEIEPVRSDPEMVEMLTREASRLELDYLVMPSGAAHDAQILAQVAPVGMVFVPSKDGISHSPAEWTDWSNILAGARLALQALMRLSEHQQVKETSP